MMISLADVIEDFLVRVKDKGYETPPRLIVDLVLIEMEDEILKQAEELSRGIHDPHAGFDPGDEINE